MTRMLAESVDPVISPSVTRIRAAALHLFAEHGPATTSLRAVAAAAGVSVGLLQRRLGTKAGLVEAVDKEVLSVMMAEPIPEPPADPVAEVGQRMSSLIAVQPTW